MITPPPYTVMLLIPTGIGAAMGGFAGDGLPIAKLLAQGCDRLITHPNVLNGAQLYWPDPKFWYVEGYGLDRFAAGDWSLTPVHQNRVGIIFDAGIEPDLQLRHQQAAEATRATLGLPVTTYITTDRPLGVELRTSPSGASWGTIAEPGSLLRAAETLVHKAGVEAIAVVARFPDDLESPALTAYRHGSGVDPLSGAEAVISHLVVRHLRVPCAHAPALCPLPLDPDLSPRAAAEELGYTFFPCVLVGLSRAPRFAAVGDRETIAADQVNALVVPESACGGGAVLALAKRTLVIAVTENTTRMKVSPETLGIKPLRVRSYLEALGAILAHRGGMDPRLLCPQLPPLQPYGDLSFSC